jgi:hypothetical protein
VIKVSRISRLSAGRKWDVMAVKAV